MFPTGSSTAGKQWPLVMYAIVGLNILLYLWDRQWHLFAPAGLVFADLQMRPEQVMLALNGTGDRIALVTLVASLFLHGNLMHIVGNLVFLVTFGDAVEEALGSWRFALYYLFWGIVASVVQIFVDPSANTPVLGASGAIGGVLGAYFLLFPASKIEVWVLFLTFVADAWKLLGGWFLFQILFTHEGVANWAHAGGFLAGMITVLVMGGRSAVLKGRETDFEDILVN